MTDPAIVWNKDKGQATVTAVITDAALGALPEILDPTQPGYHDTAAVDSEPIGVSADPL